MRDYLCGEGVFSVFALIGLKESSHWISNLIFQESQFCEGGGEFARVFYAFPLKESSHML